MSNMYCQKHDHHYDLDEVDDCPECLEESEEE